MYQTNPPNKPASRRSFLSSGCEFPEYILGRILHCSCWYWTHWTANQWMQFHWQTQANPETRGIQSYRISESTQGWNTGSKNLFPLCRSKSAWKRSPPPFQKTQFQPNLLWSPFDTNCNRNKIDRFSHYWCSVTVILAMKILMKHTNGNPNWALLSEWHKYRQIRTQKWLHFMEMFNSGLFFVKLKMTESASLAPLRMLFFPVLYKPVVFNHHERQWLW